MAKNIELREREIVVKEIRGDYWDIKKSSGKYYITNQRIHFYAKFILTLSIDIEYSEIESYKLCKIGVPIPLLPFGIQIIMKDGTRHKLSIMGRKKIMELLNQYV